MTTNPTDAETRELEAEIAEGVFDAWPVKEGDKIIGYSFPHSAPKHEVPHYITDPRDWESLVDELVSIGVVVASITCSKGSSLMLCTEKDQSVVLYEADLDNFYLKQAVRYHALKQAMPKIKEFVRDD